MKGSGLGMPYSDFHRKKTWTREPGRSLTDPIIWTIGILLNPEITTNYQILCQEEISQKKMHSK